MSPGCVGRRACLPSEGRVRRRAGLGSKSSGFLPVPCHRATRQAVSPRTSEAITNRPSDRETKARAHQAIIPAAPLHSNPTPADRRSHSPLRDRLIALGAQPGGQLPPGHFLRPHSPCHSTSTWPGSPQRPTWRSSRGGAVACTRCITAVPRGCGLRVRESSRRTDPETDSAAFGAAPGSLTARGS